MTAGIGVGFVGCGAVTQAIHLPTLAAIDTDLRVAHVMDVDPAVAAEVGSRAGARHSTDLATLLADPAVDVVAICTPPSLHAEQVEAACAAGSKAILCEKPLATEQHGIERIVAASRRSGVPVIVGAMHVHDRALSASAGSWGDLCSTAQLVRSVIVLPPNDRFVTFAGDVYTSPLPRRTLDADPDGAAARAAMIEDGILSLATHALPLVRRFAPSVDELLGARALEPWGYDLAFRSGACIVELLALAHGHWRHDWTLEAWGQTRELHAAFPPSYVLAGSAEVTVRTTDGERRWHFAENGYQAQWRHVAEVAAGHRESTVTVEDAAKDMAYALDLGAAAVDYVLAEAA